MAKIIIDPFTGVKHLPAGCLCMMVTLCGEVDDFGRWGFGGSYESMQGVEAEGIPDCSGCIDTARSVFAAITKKELKLAESMHL